MKKIEDAEILLKGRMNGNQKTRLARLLNMMYTPSELAKEVGFNKRQVYRVYIPAGLPHERDEKGHIWINGKVFREWVHETYKKQKLGKNEAYCVSCKRPVKIVNPEIKASKKSDYYLCECPICGNKTTRYIKRGKRN